MSIILLSDKMEDLDVESPLAKEVDGPCDILTPKDSESDGVLPGVEPVEGDLGSDPPNMITTQTGEINKLSH